MNQLRDGEPSLDIWMDQMLYILGSSIAKHL